MERSNIDELIKNINRLVQEKGLNSRHTTALYTIDQTMQDAIAAEPTGDADVDATILICNQNLRTMRETRSQLQQSMQNCADRASAQVKLAGAAYAENFYPGTKTETLERINQELEAELESHLEFPGRIIGRRISRNIDSHGPAAPGTSRQPPIPNGT